MKVLSKENLKKVMIGATLIGGNVVAGNVIYEQNQRINQLESSQRILISHSIATDEMEQAILYLSCLDGQATGIIRPDADCDELGMLMEQTKTKRIQELLK